MTAEKELHDVLGEMWRAAREPLTRKESDMGIGEELREAVKRAKQARVLLGEANDIMNGVQGEISMLNAENSKLREPQLPEGVEWPRFEDGELVKIGDEVEYSGKALDVDAICFDREEWSMALRRNLDISRMSGSYGELVKRPTPKVLDADGAPIEVGDTVYFALGRGRAYTVERIDANGGDPSVDIVEAKDGGPMYSVNPERLTHKRPDSWERIEEDAKLAPRDYLESRGMNPEKTERIASMMADLVRRAKALAKAGEQA